MPTWFHFGSQNRSKSIKNPISTSIKKMIDFCIEVESTLGPILAAKTGPRRAQEAAKTAKTASRGRQDGPRDGQDGPKRVQKNVSPPSFIGIGRQERPRASRDPSKTDFWNIFGLFFNYFPGNFISFFNIVIISRKRHFRSIKPVQACPWCLGVPSRRAEQ